METFSPLNLQWVLQAESGPLWDPASQKILEIPKRMNASLPKECSRLPTWKEPRWEMAWALTSEIKHSWGSPTTPGTHASGDCSGRRGVSPVRLLPVTAWKAYVTGGQKEDLSGNLSWAPCTNMSPRSCQGNKCTNPFYCPWTSWGHTCPQRVNGSRVDKALGAVSYIGSAQELLVGLYLLLLLT